MIKHCVVRAPAKINLSLDITGIREDGYHLLETVMQTIELSDIVRISLSIENFPPEGQEMLISLSGNSPDMPLDLRNTAFRAAKIYEESARNILAGKHMYLHSIDIDITKNIPLEAGLAGGSADAAGTLFGLNYLCENAIKEETLADIAVRTGADVPFCLTGGTALCTGIGEIITPVTGFGIHDIVLYKPEFGVSTVMAFRAIDEQKDLEHPDTPKVLESLAAGDVSGVMTSGGNVFESFVFAKHPELAAMTELIGNMDGASGAAMSGSGTAVFGVFGDSSSAQKAEQKLREKYNAPGRFITRTRTFAGGPAITETDKV